MPRMTPNGWTKKLTLWKQQMDQKSDGTDAKRGVKSDVPKTSKTRKTGHSAAKKLIFCTNAKMAS